MEFDGIRKAEVALTPVLTNTKLRNLKPQDRLYKVVDRDGLYVVVGPGGAVSFRLDCRLNGRRETLTIGRYGDGGVTLAEAREHCVEAKKAISRGLSPAKEKQRGKQQLREAKTFGDFAARWLKEYRMEESSRAMRESVLNRDILLHFCNRLLPDITAEDLRTLCGKIKDRGAPATAVHARDVVAQIIRYAIARGQKVANPGDGVSAASIAVFAARERSLRKKSVFSSNNSIASARCLRSGSRCVSYF
jgi:hypothetical protein